MGALTSPLRAIKRVFKADPEKLRLRKQAAEEFNLNSVDELTDRQLSMFLADDAARDVGEGAATVVRDTGRAAGTRLGAGIGVAGLGLGGAYGYSQYAETQRSAESTERQEDYYDRIKEIERMYRNGEISQGEMREMKEEARQAYFAAQGSNRDLSLTALVARMGTMELLVTLAVVGAIGVKVLPIVARRFSLPDTPDVDLGRALLT